MSAYSRIFYYHPTLNTWEEVSERTVRKRAGIKFDRRWDFVKLERRKSLLDENYKLCPN